MESFAHTIEIDEKNRLLKIFRLFQDGRREFFTSTELPDINAHDEWDSFEAFAKQLGENILMDSPSARKILEL